MLDRFIILHTYPKTLWYATITLGFRQFSVCTTGVSEVLLLQAGN